MEAEQEVEEGIGPGVVGTELISEAVGVARMGSEGVGTEEAVRTELVSETVGVARRDAEERVVSEAGVVMTGWIGDVTSS